MTEQGNGIRQQLEEDPDELELELDELGDDQDDDQVGDLEHEGLLDVEHHVGPEAVATVGDR